VDCRKLERVTVASWRASHSSCVRAGFADSSLSSLGECCTYNTPINHLSASLIGADVVACCTLHCEALRPSSHICRRVRNSCVPATESSCAAECRTSVICRCPCASDKTEYLHTVAKVSPAYRTATKQNNSKYRPDSRYTRRSTMDRSSINRLKCWF